MKKKFTLLTTGVVITYLTTNFIVGQRMLKKAGLTNGEFGRLIMTHGVSKAFDIVEMKILLNGN